MKALNRKLIKKRAIKVFSISLIFVTILMLLGFLSIYYSAEIDYTSINKLSGRILVYDNQGNQLDLPSLNTYVKYEDIDINIINAFVALEDKRFFKHKGVDYIRVFGALKNNIKYGYIKEGGSTITQQLAKNTQLSNQKTLQRKIKEAKLASDIEKVYSKEEIMEMYLNAIYFGNGIYGINQACLQLFNKSPNEIEIYQAAILAGIVKNPSKNSPLQHPTNSNKRKNLVLKLMQEQGFINELEYNNSTNKEYLPIERIKSQDVFTPYYNAVIAEASKILKTSEKTLKERNIRIETYLDQPTQRLAYKAFESKQFQYNNQNSTYRNTPDSSVLILDNYSGGAKSYYASHSHSPFELRRQPGSALKPILVYAPAFEQRLITPASLYLDEKTSFGNYSPANHLNNYQGMIDIRQAVMSSSNIVAVKVLEQNGIHQSKNIASKMGIVFDNEDNFLSLALGAMTKGVTNIELSQAYMCIANGGMHTKPTFIKCIKDMNGEILYNHVTVFNTAIDQSSAYLMTDILIDTARKGTAKKLGSLNLPIASKTGTVGQNKDNLNRDAWNISYTTDSTVCVWYGNLNNDRENDFSATGGTLPTLLARYIHQNINDKPVSFDIPNNIIELKLDKVAIREFNQVLLASANTPVEYIKKEIFDIDNCPKEFSQLFVMPKTNLKVEFDDDFYSKITFDTQPFFKYAVIRKNITTGHRQVIYNIDKSNGTITINDNINNSPFGIISYAIEVQNQYCNMGICEEKYMFLGLPFDNSNSKQVEEITD